MDERLVEGARLIAQSRRHAETATELAHTARRLDGGPAHMALVPWLQHWVRWHRIRSMERDAQAWALCRGKRGDDVSGQDGVGL